jgi:RNA polymerase subunit RPABC4/transcription elongation factor Spt4
VMIICPNCGAISFMEVEICDLCSKPFKLETSRPPAKKPRVKMSFKQFEAGKIKLNQLKKEWMEGIALEPPQKSQIKRLEIKIKKLRSELEDNIYLTMLFQPGKADY